jgi:predicted PurR-regulated permease PerM
MERTRLEKGSARARDHGVDRAPLPQPRSRGRARAAVAAAVTLLGLYIAWDFLLPLAWATVLAVTVWPAYRSVARRFPKRARFLAPAIFTLATGLVLVGPLAFAAIEVGHTLQIALQWVADAQQNGIPVPDWVAQLPLVGGRAAQWWQRNLADPQGATTFFGQVDAAKVADWTRAFGGAVLGRTVVFLVTLLALFFVLRDGEWLGERLLRLADDWLGEPGRRLAEVVVAAVRGTVIGTIVVAVGEGTLIAIGYSFAGVPHPVLLGALTIAFAMLPTGAWLAFSIASAVLLVKGAMLAAVCLFGYGAAVMLAGDNLVQPALIGGAARLPFLWALIGIVGGVKVFGLLGLFLGPVVMAALLSIWREWLDPAAARG